MVKWVNQLQVGISLHIACIINGHHLKIFQNHSFFMVTWHSSGLSTNLSWSIMLCSDRSHAPSEKSQHAPFGPERGELDAMEENRKETINHFSKENEEEDKMKTFRSARIIMCQGGTMAGRQCNKKIAFLSFTYTL